MTPEQQAEFNAAREMIRAVFEDGEAEINGRVYMFTKMVHKQRRQVFAFYSRIAQLAQSGDLSFLDTPDFEKVMDTISRVVTFEDSTLQRLGDEHWEHYPEDYVPFITTAMAVISYPFMSANPTG